MPDSDKGSSVGDPNQALWIKQVLGIDLASPKLGTGSTADLRAVWRDAKEETDAALEALGRELRTYEDPDLDRIADFGLFGIGKGENVALNKALIEFSAARGDGRAAAAKNLRAAVAAYRTLINGKLVGDIDNNPYGVQVSVRATLGHALDEIDRAAA